jgi:hypothetical protein
MRTIAVAALLLLAVAAGIGSAAEPFTPESLLRQLAAHAPLRARFVEERRMALLDQPIVVEGTLSFVPPDRLIRQDLVPRPAIYRIEGDEVIVAQGENERHFRLADEPVLAALVLPFRATLAGDFEALQRVYRLSVSGDPERWALTMIPKEARVVAMLSGIEVTGLGNKVQRITVQERDGDRTVMSLTSTTP